MRKLIGIFILLTLCLTISSAQKAKQTATDKWDVFGGYSFSRIYVANETPFPMNLQGGQGAATYNFTRHLGVTGEFALYTKDVDETTFRTEGYLFGPSARYHFKGSPVSIFGHQLFGVTHMSFTADPSADCTGVCSITTHPFTMASGGGLDVKVSKHFLVRPMQVEYFNEAISIDSIEAEIGAVRATGSPRALAEDPSSSTGIHITGQGLRYTAGAVYHF
jgi:hypothetical protein